MARRLTLNQRLKWPSFGRPRLLPGSRPASADLPAQALGRRQHPTPIPTPLRPRPFPKNAAAQPRPNPLPRRPRPGDRRPQSTVPCSLLPVVPPQSRPTQKSTLKSAAVPPHPVQFQPQMQKPSSILNNRASCKIPHLSRADWPRRSFEAWRDGRQCCAGLLLLFEA